MCLPEKDVVLHYVCIDFRHVFHCSIKYAWDATLCNPVTQVLLECSQVLCSLALLDLSENNGACSVMVYYQLNAISCFCQL